MTIKADNIADYISKVPEERQAAFSQLIEVVRDHIPDGFAEELNYGMPGHVVPHSLYPDGYHCDPKLPLPFVSMANQKNFIALYHMGIYANEDLLNWFVEEYPKHCKYKLDMGKSCIRFKKVDHIPYDLIAELMQKMTPQDWIDLYEANVKR